MQVIPLSLLVSPGLITIRILASQQAWSPTELDARRFTLRSGSEECQALPLRKMLDPFVPITVRLEFPMSHTDDGLTLVLSRGLWAKDEVFDLLRQPLYEQEQIDMLDDECHAAWFEHALELELTYRPTRLRSGAANLDEAIGLLDRYLHVVPDDEEAGKALQRIRLKKELARSLTAGDWLRVGQLNAKVLECQPGWQGPDTDRESPLEMAYQALRNGMLEVAEERLQKAVEVGDQRSAAALILARLCASWKRRLSESGHWYVQYFVTGGRDNSVAHEAARILDDLGEEGVGYRARLLAELAERLVLHSEDRELADLVFQFSEAQSAQGVDVADDFVLLWACYEKAFEQQMVVDGRVDRMLLVRLEKLYGRLGNHAGWVRIRRLLADLEPSRTDYRVELARLLSDGEEYEAAFCARMALWLAEPLDVDKTEALAEAAAGAGLKGVTERIRTLASFYRGLSALPEPEPEPGRPAVPLRLLLHPELRPLFSTLLAWGREDLGLGADHGEEAGESKGGSDAEGGQGEPAGGIHAVDERAACIRALELLGQPLGEAKWKELETVVRQLPLTPSMEAALLVRPIGEHRDGPLHPLRVAAQLSLDRVRMLDAGGWYRGLEALDPPLDLTDGVASLSSHDMGESEAVRLARYRVSELAKFYASRTWEREASTFDAYPVSPVGDLIEAIYLRGFPGWSLRTFLEDVQKKSKLSRPQWEQTQATVLRFLYLEPGRVAATVEI